MYYGLRYFKYSKILISYSCSLTLHDVLKISFDLIVSLQIMEIFLFQYEYISASMLF